MTWLQYFAKPPVDPKLTRNLASSKPTSNILPTLEQSPWIYNQRLTNQAAKQSSTNLRTTIVLKCVTTRLNHEPCFWTKTTLRFITVVFHFLGLSHFHFRSYSSPSRGVVRRSQWKNLMYGHLSFVSWWDHLHRRLEASTTVNS